MADVKTEDVGKKEWTGGAVLVAGGTDWAQLGRAVRRKKNDVNKKEAEERAERAERYPNLLEPHRIKTLMGVKIRFVAAGSAACHCIAGDMDGRCFTWGRNEKGQLGHGDLIQRNMPVIVESLADSKIIGACGGRHHTAFVAEDGKSYTCGSNLHGQCGTGVIKSKEKSEELIKDPMEAKVSDCTAVSCGIEFTMWLCDGKLYAAGLPQYGQLGDGSDHEYNAKEASVKLVYAPQPTPIYLETLAERKVVAVTCGHYHTIAVDSDGIAFSWGFGGYGRLGHKVQQDEHKPRPIETFLGRIRVEKDEGLVIAAGGTSSFSTTTGGELYSWGKLKTNGDSTMYPVPFAGLSGWKIRSMACGPSTFTVAADSSVITWGHALYGELGYGPEGKKSSVNPDKCEALEGMYAHQVASGVGYNMFLVEATEEELEKFPVWECDHEEKAKDPVESKTKTAPQGRASGKAKTNPKRKTADTSGKGSKSKKRK
ncbi:hypothetical protein BSKO_10616 [Bryopsis sp. KO-2023]|nr:hypothetical protein BSKO_10616 [Bryopsis sp. KO-2023]